MPKKYHLATIKLELWYVRMYEYVAVVRSIGTYSAVVPSKSVIIIFELFHFRAVLIEAQSLLSLPLPPPGKMRMMNKFSLLLFRRRRRRRFSDNNGLL